MRSRAPQPCVRALEGAYLAVAPKRGLLRPDIRSARTELSNGVDRIVRPHPVEFVVIRSATRRAAVRSDVMDGNVLRVRRADCVASEDSNT